MSLGDVFLIFGLMLAIGIALPGMLLALFLLFPGIVESSRGRLQTTPWQCFGTGILIIVAGVFGLGVLLSSPNAFTQLLGWAGLLLLISLASLGTAGLVALMGERLMGVGLNLSKPSAMVRGAIALELAAIFPILGWFLVIPLVVVCTIGAAGLALFARRSKRTSRVAPTEVSNATQAS